MLAFLASISAFGSGIESAEVSVSPGLVRIPCSFFNERLHGTRFTPSARRGRHSAGWRRWSSDAWSTTEVAGTLPAGAPRSEAALAFLAFLSVFALAFLSCEMRCWCDGEGSAAG